jgi:hypothetical protein
MQWYTGTQEINLLVSALKACNDGNPEFKSGNTALFARYCERLTSDSGCTNVILRLSRYKSNLCALCHKEHRKIVINQRIQNRKFNEAMERCDMQANEINTAHASGVSTQTRSTPAYSQPFGYASTSTGSADTDRSTPPQSTYSHRNGEADDLARQPYGRNQTAYTQSDHSRWSTKHVSLGRTLQWFPFIQRV